MRRDKDNPRTGGIAMRRSGFTTIEMVIVVVLIGIIAMIGFPKISKTLDKTNVRSARDAVGTLAGTARAAAIQRGCRTALHFTGNTAWVTTANCSQLLQPLSIANSPEISSAIVCTS